MKKTTITLFTISFFLVACNNQATQIGENTFVYKNKVYKIVDNELTELADLQNNEIRRFEVLKPINKQLGEVSISFIKEGASTNLDAMYRGNTLYFKLSVNGINDLKDNYSTGIFSINFIDEFDFILHKTEIPTDELIRVIGINNETSHFEYNGKTEMSTEISKAIKSYSVNSSVSNKSY